MSDLRELIAGRIWHDDWVKSVGEEPPLEDVPDDWTIEIRYEGEGSSTLIGGGEGRYRTIVGPWDAHCSESFEGYGETRSESIRAAVANAKEQGGE